MKRAVSVSPLFRAWLAVEVLFGVAALLSVARAPADTATNFAWPIRPTVMAATLGAFYLSLSPVLVLVLVARRWSMIRVIVIPGLVFTTAELVATILHWDKFSVGTLPFDVWLASYVLPPPIYLAGYLWHQRRGGVPPLEAPLPRPFRLLVVVLGAFVTLDAAIGFVHPRYFMGSFPWDLTPLTTRALCGWLLVLGTVLLFIGRENDRDRVRLASPLLILLLPALALQVSRYSGEVDASNPRFWTSVVLLALVAACGLYLARGSWRASLR